jgi:hypothetical protein
MGLVAALAIHAGVAHASGRGDLMPAGYATKVSRYGSRIADRLGLPGLFPAAN